MGKKTTILVTLCIIFLVAVSFEFFVFRVPSLQQATSVDEIVSNPSAWLNRTVLVEGNLSGPRLLRQSPTNHSELLFSPWQYNLSSTSASIGVFWSTGVALNGSVVVEVYGVVRKVTVMESIDPPKATIVYYIEAEKVESP
jgi:hypothetical protein